MAGFTDAGISIVIKKLVAGVAGVSLHSADPGDMAENELSGSGYTRQDAPLNWPGGTEVVLNSPVVFDCPGGAHVAYVGFWQVKDSEDPLNNFVGGFELDTPADIPAGGGIYTVDSGSFTGVSG